MEPKANTEPDDFVTRLMTWAIWGAVGLALILALTLLALGVAWAFYLLIGLFP